jgi:hypothetical protein
VLALNFHRRRRRRQPVEVPDHPGNEVLGVVYAQHPGHMRRPTPNGIILISLLPVMSTPHPSPPSRNLSGRN